MERIRGLAEYVKNKENREFQGGDFDERYK